MLKIMPMGPLDANCYLLYGKAGNEALVIDPSDAGKVQKVLDENGLELTHILLTHQHFDHIAGVAELREKTDAEVMIHSLDAEGLHNRFTSLAAFIPGRFTPSQPTRTLEDGDVITAAGFTIRVLHTPGHTEGGVCFVCDDEKFAFTGDTVFCASYGRTDMPGGNMRKLSRSIQSTVLKLPDDYILYPGHGEETTVALEKERNPILSYGSEIWQA